MALTITIVDTLTNIVELRKGVNMTVQRQKVKELLGMGLSNDIIANAVGCSPQHINDFMTDPDFANEVVILRTKNLSAASERDKKIDDIEDALLDKLSSGVDEIYKPRDILAAFHTVNQARRRGVPAATNLTVNNQIIQLVVPERLMRSFTMSPQGEVTDVETEAGEKQTLVTMPTATLLKELQQGSPNAQRYKDVAKYLPSAAVSRKSDI